MSVRKILTEFLPLMPFTVFMASCGEGLPTNPVPDAMRARDVAGPQRVQAMEELPFQLSADAVLLDERFAPGFGPPEFGKSDFGGRCSAPADFLISFSLHGEATHLGELTGTAEHCSQVEDFATRRITILDGILTLTTANGDRLWDQYSGETHEFVGGTGRFAGATGGGIGHPDCDPVAGTCHFDLNGTIVYDASDRRR